MDAKYPLQMRIMHWLLAVLVLCLLGVGLYMAGLPRDDTMRPTLYALHKSFGVTVLLLATLRLCFRLRFRLRIPPLPAAIPAIEAKLASLGHLGFYGLMFLMPLSGFLMTNFFGFTVNLFGIGLPKLVGPDRDLGHKLADVHEYAAYLLIGLIILHVAGVVKHRLVEKINLLDRMT